MCCILISGDVINKVYFPILVPVGIIGNLLSFLVRFLVYFFAIFMSFGPWGKHGVQQCRINTQSISFFKINTFSSN